MVSIFIIGFIISGAVATVQIHPGSERSEDVLLGVYRRLLSDTFEVIHELHIMTSQSSFEGIKARRNGLGKALRAVKVMTEKEGFSLLTSLEEHPDWDEISLSYIPNLLDHMEVL
jgi:hypothetical protein